MPKTKSYCIIPPFSPRDSRLISNGKVVVVVEVTVEGLEGIWGSDANTRTRLARWSSGWLSEQLRLTAGHYGGEQNLRFLVFPDDHQFPEMLWVSTVIF